MGGPRIVFHLGRHKTGTSSLQNLMHSNRAVLADRGVLYPLSGLRDQPWIGCRHNGLVYNTPARTAQAHDALIRESAPAVATRSWCRAKDGACLPITMSSPC
ncbi:hypothetical protein [Pseudooctadecabacter sp.]|uniref:hypothetical protein n=1 Tax=Pseudooctadecabacter sp. TaxID=1966338 RepID=UPI0035C7EC86